MCAHVYFMSTQMYNGVLMPITNAKVTNASYVLSELLTPTMMIRRCVCVHVCEFVCLHGDLND